MTNQILDRKTKYDRAYYKFHREYINSYNRLYYFLNKTRILFRNKSKSILS